MAKRGPKAQHYVTSKGETILGLSLRKKRGKQVFLPVGRDSPTFGSIEDEALAIHRFRVWQGKQKGELEPLDPDPINFGLNSYNQTYWRDYYRNLILTNPRKAAVEMDCEPLALLAHAENLKPPEPSVTLDECFDFYSKRRKKVSDEELKKVSNNWKAFQESVSPAVTLEQITTGEDSLFEKWVDDVWLPFEDEGSPKTLRHKVDRVKRVIRYCHDKKQRDKGNCQRLLDELTALELPDPNKEDPNPLSVAEFQQLLTAAKDTQWEPMLLVMLNLCYYPIDVRTLTLDAVDLKTGVVVFERAKKKTTRVGILWTRTRTALKKWIKNNRTNGVIFLSSLGTGYSAHGLTNSFKALRKEAGMGKGITMNRIRDAAYSAACASPKVEIKEAKILAGHKFSGETDAYVKRYPETVKEAVNAIEKLYFPPEKKLKKRKSKKKPK